MWKSTLYGRTVFECELQQTVAATQCKLGTNIRAMCFDGAWADEQLYRDFTAGFFPRDEFEYAAFGFGEIIKAGFLAGQRFGAAATTNEIAGNGGT